MDRSRAKLFQNDPERTIRNSDTKKDSAEENSSIGPVKEGAGPVKPRVFGDLFKVRVKGLNEKEEDINFLFHSELLWVQQ